MLFVGISRVFSTKNNEQYNTIGDFWDSLSKVYGKENLRGLGYNWTSDTIEYVIGLKDGIIPDANCSVEIPDSWTRVTGRLEDLGSIYGEIYKSGNLSYEIEMFNDNGDCEILYTREVI